MKNAKVKSVGRPYLAVSYEVAKKIFKYTLYASVLYFAYEGFMAWK